MVLLRLEDGLEKVVAGLTSVEEIMRVIDVDEDIGEDEEDLKAAFMGKVQDLTPTAEFNSPTQLIEPEYTQAVEPINNGQQEYVDQIESFDNVNMEPLETAINDVLNSDPNINVTNQTGLDNLNVSPEMASYEQLTDTLNQPVNNTIYQSTDQTNSTDSLELL